MKCLKRLELVTRSCQDSLTEVNGKKSAFFLYFADRTSQYNVLLTVRLSIMFC